MILLFNYKIVLFVDYMKRFKCFSLMALFFNLNYNLHFIWFTDFYCVLILSTLCILTNYASL